MEKDKTLEELKKELKLYDNERQDLGAHLYWRDFATMDMCLRRHAHKELEGYMEQAQHTLKRLLWVKDKIEELKKNIEALEVEKIKF